MTITAGNFWPISRFGHDLCLGHKKTAQNPEEKVRGTRAQRGAQANRINWFSFDHSDDDACSDSGNAVSYLQTCLHGGLLGPCGQGGGQGSRVGHSGAAFTQVHQKVSKCHNGPTKTAGDKDGNRLVLIVYGCFFENNRFDPNHPIVLEKNRL